MKLRTSSRPRRGACSEYCSRISGAASSSMIAGFHGFPQNPSNQRPMMSLLSCSRDMIDPLHISKAVVVANRRVPGIPGDCFVTRIAQQGLYRSAAGTCFRHTRAKRASRASPLLSKAGLDRRRSPAHQTRQQHHDKDDQKNEEQYLGDSSCGESDPAKTQKAGDQRDNQKHQRPVEHLFLRLTARPGVDVVATRWLFW